MDTKREGIGTTPLTTNGNERGGHRLYLLHKALKLEQLRLKSGGKSILTETQWWTDQAMHSKVEAASKQLELQLREALTDIHELSKKIEIVEEQYSENVARMIGEMSLHREPEPLPRRTHEVIPSYGTI